MHHLLSHAPRLALALFSRHSWRRLSKHLSHAGLERTHALVAPRSAGDAQGASPWGAGTAACAARAQQPSRPPQARPLGTPHSPVPAPGTHPVRVLRRHEGTAGRLAIVGRMADVCAELDRLAARERPC